MSEKEKNPYKVSFHFVGILYFFSKLGFIRID